MNDPIEWVHTPHKPVPWRTKCHHYSVGVNFHGLYQCIYSPKPGDSKPIGPMCATSEEAKQWATKVSPETV